MSAVLAAREPSARYLETVQPPLVRQFELLATAPGGVARLRELILALAVQGKVVQQDSDDEPASELLRRIRAERAALVAAGSIKQGKPSAPISPEEEPCSLPRGWAWVRFGDLIHDLCTGPFGSLIHKEDYVNGGVPLINPSHMIDGRIEHDPAVSVSASMASQLSAYRLSVGDVLLARRGEMGRYALVTEREAGWLCGTGSFFLKLSKAYDRRFFGLTLEDPRLRRHLLGESVGATMTNLNQRILLDVVVAVAPLAEQARIVARVDELMRLCDAVEAKGRLEAEQHARLLGTLLGTLTGSTTPNELATNWHRVAEHFDLLLDRPEAVDALEQTILKLAMRGLLVLQDPREMPAVATSSAKMDFPIPSNWKSVALAAVCSLITDGEHATPERCSDVTQVPLVTAKNVRSEHMDWRNTDFVPRAVAQSCWKRCKPQPNDILMVSVGATLGRLAILVDDLEMVLVRSVTVVRPDESLVNVSYLALHLMSPGTQDEIWASVKQSAQPCLYLSKSAALRIALPPLAEQARIVARVTELRRLCADLRQRLAACLATHERLADALVATCS